MADAMRLSAICFGEHAAAKTSAPKTRGRDRISMRAPTITRRRRRGRSGARLAEVGRVKVLSVVRLGFAAWFLLLPAAGCRDHDGKKKAPAPEARSEERRVGKGGRW